MSTTSTPQRVTIGLPYAVTRNGQVHAVGISHASKKTVEELVLRDAEEHHCVFNDYGFHNHLSHHLLAAYDLGASAEHLKEIWVPGAKTQRPIFVRKEDESIVVTDDNWTQHLGNFSAYGGYVKFFADKVRDLGVTDTFEKYVFDRSANENGVLMLDRFLSGALHPYIQFGHGAEFGIDTLIATGLAQAAAHKPTAPPLFQQLKYDESEFPDTPGLTVLELLRQVYDSEKLTPPGPYDPDVDYQDQVDLIIADGRAGEIIRICEQFHVNIKGRDAEYERKVEELIWASVLIMAATGREGRKPRMDFFLMHFATSSLFLLPVIKVLKNPAAKANFLKAFFTVVVLLTLARGRPRINPKLLMSYSATPRPPLASPNGAKQVMKSALGSPLNDEHYNPWPAMLEDVIYHPDEHIIKAFRALVHAAQHYGNVPPGGAIGAFTTGASGEKVETHPGTGEMDGTIFVRAAGLMMDYMGWVTNGQEARPDWDRTHLGWDAAWEKSDD